MRTLRLDTSWGELRLVGGSRAGEGTLLLLPQLRVALDAGRPSRALVPMQHVAITHGHLDHLLGLPFWASQRHLQGIAGGTVLAPATIAARVSALLALVADLEGGKPYGVRVEEVRDAERVALRPGLALRFFATDHWVPTLGCCVEWRRRRLRAQLAGRDQGELRALRAAGEEISEEVVTPLLAYAADSGPGLLAAEPWLAETEVLVLECSFLAPADRERARRFGHTHLDDLVAVAEQLHNRHLVLTHLSRRHRLADGHRRIRTALAGKLASRLHFLNVEWE